MIAYTIATFVGISIVFQGALNRVLSDKTNLSFTVLWNAIIFLLASIAYFAFDQMKSGSDLKLSAWTEKLQWWTVLPGIAGIIIVAGIPNAIEKIGASRTFLVVVVSQLLMSMAWDYFSDGAVPGFKQILGVLFAIISVWLIK